MIFVRKSSSYYPSLLDLNSRLLAQDLNPIDIVAAEETLATEDILEMVNAGILNMTVVDSHLVKLWA